MDTARLARLWVELDIRKTAADDQQCLATFERVLRRPGAEQADTARRIRARIRHAGFAEHRLDDRGAENLGDFLQFLAGADGTAAGYDDRLFALIEQLRRFADRSIGRDMGALGPDIGDMVRPVALRAQRIGRHFLHIDRHRHMRDAAIGERGAASQLDDILDMRRAHDAVVVFADVDEELVELDILLGLGVQQVVELQTGDRQYRNTVELGVVEPVQQVDAARAGGCDADAEATGKFGVAAGGEGRRLLVPYLDKADLVLALAEGFDDAVDAIAGNAEDGIDAPSQQGVDQNVAGGRFHGVAL